jgi:putative nucleotidyltransferase with HDIG domain
MAFYAANFEFIKMKEIFKGDPEWEKAFALFHCLTLRDRETAEHSIEVGFYAAKIAEKLGLYTSRYFLAGLLHDIGKISMNDHPLKSDDILTQEERINLRDHVIHGVLTLSSLGFGKDIVRFCLRHHERLDGSGYPFGVSGTNITIEGRISQVADVFAALTCIRPYRKNSGFLYSHKEALEMMKNDSEKGKFDQKILGILEDIVMYDILTNRQYA